MVLQREWGHRLRFVAVPKWGDDAVRWVDNWLLRLEAFYNLGSRIAKFHASPGTMATSASSSTSVTSSSLVLGVRPRTVRPSTPWNDG